jgi:hypothetical protein
VNVIDFENSHAIVWASPAILARKPITLEDLKATGPRESHRDADLSQGTKKALAS